MHQTVCCPLALSFCLFVGWGAEVEAHVHIFDIDDRARIMEFGMYGLHDGLSCS